MSHEYAISRVRDALEKSGNNQAKAQRLIANWIEKDHSFLLGLSAPHLQGIIAHAIVQAGLPQSKKLPKHVDLEQEKARPGKASQKHIDAIQILAKASEKNKDKK